MKNPRKLTAILRNASNLEAYAKAVNNGRTEGVCFYVNGHKVSVFYAHADLSEEAQLDEINWFLKGRAFEVVTN